MTAVSEIAPGLLKIDCRCMVFAIRCPEGVILIDAGEGKEFAANLDAVKAAGLELPKFVLITHDHFDHTRAAKQWRDLGAKIAISELEAPRVEDGSASQIPCPVDVRLQPYQELHLLGQTIKVHGAPGHTPGSLAFETLICGERWLFTGDLVMLNRCPGWLGQFNFNDTLATLKKLARLPADSIGTGHSFIRGDGTGLLVDSLCAAFDGTWHDNFLKCKDQFPGGTVPEEILRRTNVNAGT